MAKTIIVMRHAATESFSQEGDKKRRLIERGVQDVESKSKIWLEKNYPIPEKIIYSSATRTTQTMAILRNGLDINDDSCISEDILYYALLNDIDTMIQRIQDNSTDCIAIIGHNNTVTDYLNKKIKDFRIDHLPTSGIVGFRMMINDWKENNIHLKGEYLFHEI